MRADAAAHATEVPAFGFLGDLATPAVGRFYGSLVWDGMGARAASAARPGSDAGRPGPDRSDGAGGPYGAGA